VADFSTALVKTLKHEGGYANDPLDPGGETYHGISRRAHPGWPGWVLVDAQRWEDPALKSAVSTLYRARYWNPVGGDAIPDQTLAEEVFDAGVNVGLGRVARWAQIGLNVLGGTLAEDGAWGSKTRAALASITARDARALYVLLRSQRGMHYLNLAQHGASGRRFIRGWLSRL
jgi:lysozyme family protein